MKKKKKKLTLVIVALFVCLIPIANFVLPFGSALTQEGDTVAILRAAWSMNRDGSDLRNVDSTGRRWLMRTGSRYRPMENYLGQRGWRHHDQMGNSGIYEKNGQKMRVSFRMFSRNYMICQADTHP